MTDELVPLDLYRAALAERDEWKARYDDLLTKYHALRVEGQQAPLPPAKPAEPDAVALAIVQRSFGSRALRKQYADYVTLKRSEGVDEAAIAAEILRGESEADEEREQIPAEDWPLAPSPIEPEPVR